MRRSLASLGLTLGLLATHAGAQEYHWVPVPPPAPVTRPAGLPVVRLGQPVAREDAALTDARVTPTAYVTPAAPLPPPVVRLQAPDVTPAFGPSNLPPPSASLGWQPVSATIGTPQASTSYQVPPPPPGAPAPPFVPAGPPPGPPPAFPTAPGAAPGDGYNCGAVNNNPVPPNKGGLFGSYTGLGGADLLGTFSGPERRPFQSDQSFKNFISPVSNPFLFEDPRALTEARPIFIYQLTPNHNWLYHGGDIEFFGVQGRVAVTDRLSLVVNKFGEIWDQPSNPGPIGTHTGLAEVWLGPKYTFLRNDCTNTVAAGGVTFQIPAGSDKVAQNTGNLSVVPYLSVAQNFAKDFNFMSTLGYSFGDDARSDYFYNSLHLDYDVGGLHRIYPLVELNWFHYTAAGTQRDLNFEGTDLFNFGSQGTSGHDSLTMAVGARFKINDFIQTGFAVEFPLIRDDLMSFRTTIDVILRY